MNPHSDASLRDRRLSEADVIAALRAGGELLNVFGAMHTEDWVLIGSGESRTSVRRVAPETVIRLAGVGVLQVRPVYANSDRVVRARLASPEQRRARFRLVHCR